MLVLFFFKQKTADEWRISDWSSDVCSSDLRCSLKSRVTSVSASSGGWPSTCLLTARKTELSWDRGDRSGGSRTRSICCRGTVRGNSSPEGRRVLLRPAASGSWLYGCHVPLLVVAMERHQRRLAVDRKGVGWG